MLAYCSLTLVFNGGNGAEGLKVLLRVAFLCSVHKHYSNYNYYIIDLFIFVYSFNLHKCIAFVSKALSLTHPPSFQRLHLVEPCSPRSSFFSVRYSRRFSVASTDVDQLALQRDRKKLHSALSKLSASKKNFGKHPRRCKNLMHQCTS